MRRTYKNGVGELLSGQALTARELGSVRQLLTGWATNEGLDTDTVHAIELGGYEALANCVEHGYREQGGGLVELYADHTDNRVTVTVVDHGQWQIPTERLDRGRGLVLIHGLSTHAVVAPSNDGTTVTMTWLL